MVTQTDAWEATSWLFRWVADYVADKIDDENVSRRLQEMIAENLPYHLDLTSYHPNEREAVLKVIRDNLVDDAEQRLPGDLANRREALGHLQQLADLANQALGERSP